ncbi:hypothetical protein [Candidatus Odyssella thessalonicensis]|uniref:hypothetical protein n=1 Tax=Candidatus Odyssella thessalonicensis TaxID=84647 RepID=UPI000225A8F9|nr:hypothetical protein [Candidatus Odyssella thessalonicensis]
MVNLRLLSVLLLSLSSIQALESTNWSNYERATHLVAQRRKLENAARDALRTLPLTESEFNLLRERETEEIIWEVDRVKNYADHLEKYLPQSYFTLYEFNDLKNRSTEQYIPEVAPYANHQDYLLAMRSKRYK